MRIALIGAPGAGKSKLADHLFTKFNERGIHFAVVDGLDERLRKSGLPVGEDATFREGLLMHAEEYRWESVLRRDETSFITCGTGVSRTAHALIRYHSMALSTDTDERRASDIDLVGSEMLAALMIDAMVYDVIVYVPLADPLPDPDATVTTASNFEATVDAHIRQLLTDFDIPAVWLEGSEEERLAAITVLADRGAPSDRSDDTGTTEVPD